MHKLAVFILTAERTLKEVLSMWLCTTKCGTEAALCLFTPHSMPLSNGCQFSEVNRSSTFYHKRHLYKPSPLPRQVVAAWLSPPPLLGLGW